MTVEELMEELGQYDPKLKVTIIGDNKRFDVLEQLIPVFHGLKKEKETSGVREHDKELYLLVSA